ncbi:hypothetical protein ACUFKR_003617 [Vibrio cholerae]|uniref:Uncharacterized protein n=1 Tax=Vibrio cholerae TaxID=666 RepID=A0A5C9T0M5_VIBCL|nr:MULTISPECIES: hypothetical protein [Vibrio]EGR4059964.1 hypothetical protein [Vibrio cholerae]EGR4155406.1 hypothetical protein [Vibrio cholerae]EGR4418570.1 hypothetical protein [Vibrio cholerae]EJL6347036.1 hypothetical protein [Vibrio cholerae]EJL6898262.1 hypothetical protein [Vibrio cholerae]
MKYPKKVILSNDCSSESDADNKIVQARIGIEILMDNIKSLNSSKVKNSSLLYVKIMSKPGETIAAKNASE